MPLKESLRRAERRRKIKAAGLVMPLFLFLLTTFITPILLLLYRAVDNPEIIAVMPRTVEAIGHWDGSDLPDEAVFAALAADLRQAQKDRTVGKAAKRLNYDITGFRSLVNKTARKISRIKTQPASYRDTIVSVDKRWEDLRYWSAVKQAARPYTDFYLLAAVDLTRDRNGNIARVPAARALYTKVFIRTFWMSLMVTFWCLLLGYPVAWMLASLPLRYSNLLMILVLLPFWTSLLVRTASWIIVLQKEGIVNHILMWAHITSEPVQLVYNRFGVYVAMVHILLPFMILPLYSVMKNIPPSYMRAASSLGANPIVAFFKVYLPQSKPGISAGCLLVFILAIGYYITPALVGGASGQLIGNFIALHMSKTLNWGLAGAMGTILLGGVLVIYWIYNRIVGIENMKLG